MRAGASFLLTLLALGGCALPVNAPDWLSEDSAGPEPVNYRFILANGLDSIMGTDAQNRFLEISSLRRVNISRGATWMVCIKAMTYPSRQPRAFYAVFIQRNKIVESRLSVVIDQCETETYSTFDWSADASNPVLAR